MLEKFTPYDAPARDARPFKVICCGAGLIGIHFAARFREFGHNVDFVILEKNESPGGTWHENQYPGVGCDIPSHAYTFDWAPFPSWDRFMSAGSECQRYALHVAKRAHVYDYIKFGTAITSATWDEEEGDWTIGCKDVKTGREFQDRCNVFINASGLLSQPRYPNIPGLKDFKGDLIHTARWNKNVNLKGKKIALVGAGSSAIQCLPTLQREGASVDMYIKDGSTYITPVFGAAERDRFFAFGDTTEEGLLSEDPYRVNPLYNESQREKFAKDPKALHEHRANIAKELNQPHYERWTWSGSKPQEESIKVIVELTKKKLAKKPELAKYFIPSWGVACRRPTPGIMFFEAICEDNVQVVPAKMAKLTATGGIDGNGVERQYDTIILATGFNTSFSPPFPVTGRNGYSLNSGDFSDNPRSYMVSCLPNMPNFFVPAGPFIMSVNGEFLVGLTKIADYIVKCIFKIQRERYKSMCAKSDAIEDFTAYADAYLKQTVHTEGCSSWYKAGEVNKPPRAIWPGTTISMMEILQEPRWEDFDYTRLPKEQSGPSRFNWMGNGRGFMEDCLQDFSYYLPVVEDPDADVPKAGTKEARRYLPPL